MKKELKKIHAIINPVSGVGSKDKIPEMIASCCLEKGISMHIEYTEYAGHAGELTLKALDSNADCVIAAGGDGTVNEIARNLLNTDVMLGIIPKGSGNGLARDLNIPMDTKSAVDVIFSGHTTMIDACKANERLFFCTCGVGFDAAVSKEFAKEKHRGSLTYVKDIVENYLNYKPEIYELNINNQTIREKAFLIACANASQYGNNAFIAPNADINDGKIDITILSPFNALDIGPLALQLFTKTIDKNSKIKTIRATEAQIVRQKAGVMHIDGEPVMEPEEINISVINSAIHVFTPASISFVEDMQRRFNEVFRFFEDRLTGLSELTGFTGKNLSSTPDIAGFASVRLFPEQGGPFFPEDF
ncbi:MAG: diacylglycerol kinase family lipid kinase [Tannerella sp.]|jgi:YegS/Rv2252/BmrU family lipid kinase|nr:diacylglycerol kinase family lipid kinase [Tannerella sp.]